MGTVYKARDTKGREFLYIFYDTEPISIDAIKEWLKEMRKQNKKVTSVQKKRGFVKKLENEPPTSVQVIECNHK
jgi:hypothetical protein